MAAALNAKDEMSRLSEGMAFTTFYIAAGAVCLLFAVIFLAWGAAFWGDSDNDFCADTSWTDRLWITFKAFDVCTDWSMYAITLNNPRFTDWSRFGAASANGNGNYKQMQVACLFFSILGTILFLLDFCVSGCGVGKLEKSDKVKQGLIKIGTALFEDVPQITIAGLYLWSTGGIDLAANPDDVVPVVSLIASCIFLVIGLVGGCIDAFDLTGNNGYAVDD